MGLGLVEAETKTFQYITHHLQRFLYVFSAQRVMGRVEH
jgi:hypothetical protein